MQEIAIKTIIENNIFLCCIYSYYMVEMNCVLICSLSDDIEFCLQNRKIETLNKDP